MNKKIKIVNLLSIEKALSELSLIHNCPFWYAVIKNKKTIGDIIAVRRKAFLELLTEDIEPRFASKSVGRTPTNLLVIEDPALNQEYLALVEKASFDFMNEEVDLNLIQIEVDEINRMKEIPSVNKLQPLFGYIINDNA
jgi:hypothetical protein